MKNPRKIKRMTVIAVNHPDEIYAGSLTPKKICGARSSVAQVSSNLTCDGLDMMFRTEIPQMKIITVHSRA